MAAARMMHIETLSKPLRWIASSWNTQLDVPASRSRCVFQLDLYGQTRFWALGYAIHRLATEATENG